jgi:hypothetical protein
MVVNLLDYNFGVLATQKEVEELAKLQVSVSMQLKDGELTLKSLWTKHSILCASYQDP